MPPLVLIVVGLVATRLPLGFYVPCVAAIVIAMAVVHKTATWERHHTRAIPLGVDLIPPSNPASDKFDRGQWEQMARETALSLQHWTIGVALASALVMASLYVRRASSPANRCRRTYRSRESMRLTRRRPGSAIPARI